MLKYVGESRRSYLAFTVSPKVHHHADNVVEAGVCALVNEKCTQRTERIHDEACFNGAMQTAAGEQRQWPFPGDTDYAEDNVENLQDGNGLDGAIEVLGEEIPEDLGPEEAVETGGYLVWESCEQLAVCSRGVECNLQAAAVRTMRRAQWFLINLPIVQEL